MAASTSPSPSSAGFAERRRVPDDVDELAARRVQPTLRGLEVLEGRLGGLRSGGEGFGSPVAGDPARVQTEAERGRAGGGGLGGHGFREPSRVHPYQVVEPVAARPVLLRQTRVDQDLQDPLGVAVRQAEHGRRGRQAELDRPRHAQGAETALLLGRLP
ncbi:hypothetical protein ADK57_01725 [Streptomyces sp. MMG1533]|uniref:hypothetical protein n=1 Tax=Streptomyces sp. MMG1533 TaxID=1415546 RepID=UPI0006AF3217|nr:hypothetical protein [Streptomyces sp. MMG1533]KOU77613.1 hypothetical protein ADK57_01725 [Streptomyces sp. MMG1533]